MRDIKIKDSVYFPCPQAMYKEVPMNKIMGTESVEYMKAWTFNGLYIVASIGEYDDGKEWLHVSVSRKSRLPTYEELTRIKRDFIGDDKKAVFILPEKEKHVNIHEFCLHLFYSAENPLPDFTAGIGSI